MRICDINPFIRYAGKMPYKSDGVMVNVFDSRLFYIISGKLDIFVENKQYSLSASSVFYCPGGSVYTIKTKDECEMFSLNFDLTRARSELEETQPLVKMAQKKAPVFSSECLVEDCDFFNLPSCCDGMGEMYIPISDIIQEFSDKKALYREKSSAMLKAVLIDIYRREQRTNESSNETVEKVISYINANYYQKLANKQLAEMVGYHEYHLNRIFLKYTGSTIHNYIVKQRLFQSKQLLTSTDMPLYRIAEITGFNSNSHFAECFKNCYGCSPSEYKNSMKK